MDTAETILKQLRSNLSNPDSAGRSIAEAFREDFILGDDDEMTRYLFDAIKEPGWKQYDTSNDAWYFGTWVNLGSMEILQYVEGDIALTRHLNKEAMKVALDKMAKLYGIPPPAFIAYNLDGQRMEYFDVRPEL